MTTHRNAVTGVKESVVVSARWARFLMRLFQQRGRVMLTVSIDEHGEPLDWTVVSMGAIEGRNRDK